MATVVDDRPAPILHRVVRPDGRATEQWNGFFGWVAKRNKGLVVSATYDPPSLAAGAAASANVTVTGARPGQWAMATLTTIQAGVVLKAEVTANDTVTVTLLNLTAGAVDLASGILRVRVEDLV